LVSEEKSDSTEASRGSASKPASRGPPGTASTGATRTAAAGSARNPAGRARYRCPPACAAVQPSGAGACAANRPSLAPQSRRGGDRLEIPDFVREVV